jgi:hypothetical protein
MKKWIFLTFGFLIATWMWNTECGQIAGCVLLSISPWLLAAAAFSYWAKI